MAPPEPTDDARLPPPPRRVAPAPGPVSVALCFGLGAVACLVVPFAAPLTAGRLGLADAARLARLGRPAAARVVGREVTPGRYPSRVLVYEFAAGGATHTGRAEVGRAAWDGHLPGADLAIAYLPDDPAVSTTWPPLEVLAWLLSVSAGLVGAGAVMGWLAVYIARAVRLELRLARCGRLVPGVVEEAGPWWGRAVRVRYTPAPGAEPRTCPTEWAEDRSPLKAGQAVDVLVDPDRPGEAMPVPLFSCVRPAPAEWLRNRHPA